MNVCAMFAFFARGLGLSPSSPSLTTPDSRRRVVRRLRNAQELLAARVAHVTNLIDTDSAEIVALKRRRDGARLRRDERERLHTLLCKRLARINESAKLQRIGLLLWTQEKALENGATLAHVYGALESSAAYMTAVTAETQALNLDELIEAFNEHQDVANEVAASLAGVDELALMSADDVDEHLAELCAEQGIDIGEPAATTTTLRAAATTPPALTMRDESNEHSRVRVASDAATTPLLA